MKPVVLILFGFLLAAGTAFGQQKATIAADSTAYDFGDIVEKDGKVSHTFRIENTGDAPLVITNVIAACGCTEPEWTKSPIAAGKTGKVTVTYNPDKRPGAFEKTIRVYSNGSEGSFILTIKGNVVDRLPAKNVVRKKDSK